MKMKVNLSEQGQFEPIPADWYNAYVFDVKRVTFKTGSTGLKVMYKIADEPYKGRTIFDNLVETEKAFFKCIEFYKAVTGKTSGEEEVDTSTFPDYVGKKVRIKVDIDGDWNRVKRVAYLEGTHQNEMDNLEEYMENRPAVSESTSNEDFPF